MDFKYLISKSTELLLPNEVFPAESISFTVWEFEIDNGVSP